MWSDWRDVHIAGNANRMLTFLGQARIIDDQKGIGAADEPIHSSTYNIFNVQRHLTSARTH